MMLGSDVVGVWHEARTCSYICCFAEKLTRIHTFTSEELHEQVSDRKYFVIVIKLQLLERIYLTFSEHVHLLAGALQKRNMFKQLLFSDKRTWFMNT